MHVNSVFTCFLTNRLVVRSGIVLVLFAIFSIASSFTDPTDRNLLAKKVNLLIRQIGHRLLLQAGDSTSRVLPVTETKEGTFLLQFEKKLVFNHDSLWALSQAFLPKAQWPAGYTVTVHECRKRDIIYGFQVNNATPDVLPCLGRNQPRGCYTIEFVFPDLYGNIAEEKAITGQPSYESKSVKNNQQGENVTPDRLNSTALDYNPARGTEEHNSIKVDSSASIKVDSSAVNSKHEGTKPATFNDELIYAGILVLLVSSFLIWRHRKNVKSPPVQDQNHVVLKELAQELNPLGKFLFNVKARQLLLGTEVISLTDKECKVLELLHKNFGVLIPRETLMQEIWINEGVITGRSLDMFVSKLRKKLSADPGLRINNVHGKGYKLELV